jgi:hypothetical protein
MKREGKILLGTAAVLGVGALLLELTKKGRNNGSNGAQSSFDGRQGLVRLRPTAPVSPSMPITAVQYYGADGQAAAAPAAAPAPPPPSSITPPSAGHGGHATSIAPTTTTTTPPSGGTNGGHHHHKKHPKIINIGYPYYWGYPYWNYAYWGHPLWNPYGHEKSVYCMTQYGTLTKVDGCGALETAEHCCKRKSRRAKS